MRNALFNLVCAAGITGMVRAIGWIVFDQSMTYGETNIFLFIVLGLCRLTDVHKDILAAFKVLNNK